MEPEPSVDFDFDEVDRNLAAYEQMLAEKPGIPAAAAAAPSTTNATKPTATSVTIDAAASQRVYTKEDVAHALHEYARWLILGLTKDTTDRERSYYIADTIAKRAIASAWVLDAQLFEGRTLADVGRLPCIRFSRERLAVHAREFSDVFHIPARGLRTDTARKNYSRAAKRRWAKKAASPVAVIGGPKPRSLRDN